MPDSATNTRELVEQTLSIFPHMSKKLFGPVHILHDSPLHHTHFHILHIVEDAGSIRTTDIAKKIAVKKSNLTPLLNKLFDYNYITRSQDPDDKRAILIELTAVGKTFLAEKKEIIETDVEYKLAALSEVDREKLSRAVADLHDVIGKLNE
ncbi:MarR family winged helix-turn-helix transcriptional regulator [Salisediminibacterium halotolerans]|uniref:DNA-binding transcriptional regulator, MarR family n=1 Tax=Salisediminibacterium halotolerans TaxID=517425 RepID=A0A1H9WXD9_9BACI|nr:MarR family transcriptional regulator [Salisediminibacterium haloalkalitolerans]SES38598.1 DNA-binding transcriptional regulator, MarR family [Salisediminibacterium haloalkalitolerans]